MFRLLITKAILVEYCETSRSGFIVSYTKVLFIFLIKKVGNKAYSVRKGTERIVFPFVSETPKQIEPKQTDKKQVEKKENQRKKRTMELDEDFEKSGPFNDCLRQLKLCRSKVILEWLIRIVM